ncbi:MAG: carboxypeptidase-like regulatory domain-containing protein, partial [Chitinophagaceae bacterium]
MKGSRSLLVLFFLLASLLSFSQEKFTINGYVKDSLSGESVMGATVAAGGRSVNTNQYGFYSLTLDSGDYELLVSHVSYLTYSQTIQLTNNLEQTILLLPRSSALNEVVVFSRRRDANVRNAQMGQIDLSISQIKNVPAFLGEVDILKAIQLLPGVRNAGEGNAGFYVRGGGP